MSRSNAAIAAVSLSAFSSIKVLAGSLLVVSEFRSKCSSHFVLKPPGQFSRCVRYLQRWGPDVDRAWSVSSRWHSPHTIVSGRSPTGGRQEDLKVNRISSGSPSPSGQQQRTSGSFQGTSVTEDDADPDFKVGRKPVPSVCTAAAYSSKQTPNAGQYIPSRMPSQNIMPTYLDPNLPNYRTIVIV